MLTKAIHNFLFPHDSSSRKSKQAAQPTPPNPRRPTLMRRSHPPLAPQNLQKQQPYDTAHLTLPRRLAPPAQQLRPIDSVQNYVNTARLPPNIIPFPPSPSNKILPRINQSYVVGSKSPTPNSTTSLLITGDGEIRAINQLNVSSGGIAVPTEKGLENNKGQYNCFINVVIQALWHLACIYSLSLLDLS